MRVSPSVAVCVPVRNEEQLLPGLLDSLARQVAVDDVTVSACFFLDGCDDDSAAVIDAARAHLSFAIHVAEAPRPPEATVGRARRRAMDLGLATLDGMADGVLLSTDADTVLAPDWISRNLAALRRADLVTGDIRQPAAEFCARHARVAAYFDRLHLLNQLLDPVPWQARRAHHHAGAASMAFRVDTYRRLNGFPELARGEDMALVAAARHGGLRVRRDADVVVYTSMRREGRVEDGFAAHLEALDRAGTAEAMLVVDPRVAAWQYRGHALARRAFGGGERKLAPVAAHVGAAPADLTSIHAQSPNAEAFAVRAVAMPEGAEPLPLAEAERRLARLVGHRRSPRRMRPDC